MIPSKQKRVFIKIFRKISMINYYICFPGEYLPIFSGVVSNMQSIISGPMLQ